MTSFIVLKALSALVMPPASLAVASLLCLLLVALRWRRLGIAVLVLGLAQTLILAVPVVGDALVGYLETRARVAEQTSPRCCFEAIVVLGGGIMPAVPPERPVPDLNDSSDRIWQAARFYHQGIAPRIIVSGGGFLARTNAAATTEASAMRLFLMDLGVPSDAIVSEDRSINTIENLREVRRMVGEGRVALVTSAYHMPRALRIAAQEKLAVSAFPVDFRSQVGTRPWWDEWIPSVEGLSLSTVALREIVALNLDWRIGREST